MTCTYRWTCDLCGAVEDTPGNGVKKKPDGWLGMHVTYDTTAQGWPKMRQEHFCRSCAVLKRPAPLPPLSTPGSPAKSLARAAQASAQRQAPELAVACADLHRLVGCEWDGCGAKVGERCRTQRKWAKPKDQPCAGRVELARLVKTAGPPLDPGDDGH